MWVEETEDNSTGSNEDLLDRVKAGQTEVVDQSDFLNDTLFCEYAYFVDFEMERVEVHCDGDWAVWTFEGLVPGCFEDIYQVLEAQAEGSRQGQITET